MKVLVPGTAKKYGKKVFMLLFVPEKNPRQVANHFFYKGESGAVWNNELKPAFGKQSFFLL